MILFYSNTFKNIAEIYGFHSNPELIPNLSDFTYIEITEEFLFPDVVEGKVSKSFINLETREVTHIYENAPPDPTYRITQLEQDNLALKLALVESEEIRINENL